tara:strand:+ start:7685 stop:7822 length:138 start_codon:yes stop_codon:yes gene_type:complete
MTEENQKKLYNHYVSSGQSEKAEEIALAYPHFVEEAKSTKSKKDK